MRNLAYSLCWLAIAALCIVARRLWLATLLILVCCFFFCLPTSTQAARYVWQQADARTLALLDYDQPAGTRHVGSYDIPSGVYLPFTDGQWGKPSPLPAQLPEGVIPPRKPQPKPEDKPTGVIIAKVPQGEGVWKNGVEIDRQKALDMLGAPRRRVADDDRIPDDQKHIRVSVIGSKEKCAGPVAVAKQHKDLVTADYRPDAWMIQRQGFVCKNDPTIYIQDAKGAVLRRLDGYEGDTAFESVLEDVERKIGPDPIYDPSKDEGWTPRLPKLPKLPRIPKLPSSEDLPWMPAAVATVLTAWAFLKKSVKL